MEQKRFISYLPIGLYLLLAFLPFLSMLNLLVNADTPFSQTVVESLFEYQHYWKILFNTILISLLVTLSVTVIGYPMAMLLHYAATRLQKWLLFIVMASMWLGILIRSFAWIVLLQRNGWLGLFLRKIQLLEAGDSLLATPFAVVLGMVHILLPIFVFLTWTTLGTEVHRLEKIAYSLGASRLFFWLKIFVPYSITGVLAGSGIVFLLSMGFYITPSLLGRGALNTLMFSQLIEEQMLQQGDWALGVVLSLLLLMTIVAIGFALLLSKRIRHVLNELTHHARS